MDKKETIDLSERSERFNIHESEFALKREVTKVVISTFARTTFFLCALVIIGMGVDFAYHQYGHRDHVPMINGYVLMTLVGSITSQIAAFSLAIKSFLPPNEQRPAETTNAKLTPTPPNPPSAEK